ncbi:hypothetical protein [Micromonospora zamorensis]|uniref:hypothetical protein n=1 Tax=Micromonospora zamorensis TaxID=709883 RepID=UPI0037AC5E03
MTADPTDRLGPGAGARLGRLVEQAEREGPAPVTWTEAGPRPGEPSSWSDELGCLVAAVTGLVLVALTIVGLITVLRWAW